MIGGSAGKKYIRYTTLGFEIAAGLSLPIILGYWLDSRWDTLPWLTLIGVLLGIGSFAATIIRTNRSLQNDDKDAK